MVERVVVGLLPDDFPEEWDLERLVAELDAVLPDEVHASTTSSRREQHRAARREHRRRGARVLRRARDDVPRRRGDRPASSSASIMLQIIDQRWRQHLVEMDYLREGIHLRGIAQTDPLVAWQREGFEMFGKLMDSIDDDYLRYVMHVQCSSEPTEAAPTYAQATYEAADDPVRPSASLRRRRAPGGDARVRRGQRRAGAEPGRRRRRGGDAVGTGPRRPQARLREPVAGSRARRRRQPASTIKVGRNEPCWCGSGGSSSSATARTEPSMARTPDDAGRRRRRAPISALRCSRPFARRLDAAKDYLRLDELRSELDEPRGRGRRARPVERRRPCAEVTTAYGRVKADIDELDGARRAPRRRRRRCYELGARGGRATTLGRASRASSTTRSRAVAQGARRARAAEPVLRRARRAGRRSPRSTPAPAAPTRRTGPR